MRNKERRDSRTEGDRKGGIYERRHSRNETVMKRGMQEMRNSKNFNFGYIWNIHDLSI